jgi:uncharacterized protein
MRVDEEFVVPGDPDRVWELVQDMDVIAACMPGAELTGQSGDGKYTGTITVAFGPTKVQWRGELGLVADEAQRAVQVEGRGKDQRGQSQAKASVDLQLKSAVDGARLLLRSDVEIAGVLAAFAKTGGEPILRSILDDFRENFIAYVGAQASGAATTQDFVAPRAGSISVLRHVWRAFTEWFRRVFKRNG